MEIKLENLKVVGSYKGAINEEIPKVKIWTDVNLNE